MGSVYLGEHTLLGRRAAIKVLHPMFTTRQDIVERFFNEARAATSIQDPGIVQIFDFGFHDGMAFIVMEHLVGESLHARGRRIKRFPEAEVLRHVRQIALSLHAAHARGVVHRDLKPDNVYVVADPEAAGGERTKILDFGIAKLTDATDRNLTQTGLLLGTPSYMSPEQCRGAGTIDHRSDIYSLGCMMFRMVTGRPVFEAEGSGDLIAMHLREPPRPPSSVTPVRPELDAIVLRCLAKSPDDRYQSMHDLAVEVDHLLRTISAPGVALHALTPLPPAAIPPPTQMTPITNLRAEIPTTLSSGVGQQAAVPPATMTRARQWPIIGALSVVLIAGGAIAIIAATHGRGNGGATDEPHAASAPKPTPVADPAPAPASTPVVAPAPALPPATVPAPTPTVADVGSGAAQPAPKKPRTRLKTKPKPTSTTDDSMYDDR